MSGKRASAPEDAAEEPRAVTFVLPEDADAEARLVAALAAAQAEFPSIPKSHTAEVRPAGKSPYSYTYADLSDVLAAVRPVLARHGMALIQRTSKPDGNGKTLLQTMVRHVAGASIDSEAEIAASSASPQQFGSSLTYLRRYEITTLLGIAAEEDTDAQHVDPDTPASGGRQRQQLPQWAIEAPRERKAQLLVALERIGLPRDRANAFLKTAAATWGHVPDVVVGFANGLADLLAPVTEPESAADEERRAQDAAAEQPDLQTADEHPQQPSSPDADADPPAGDEPLAPEQTDDDAPQPDRQLDTPDAPSCSVDPPAPTGNPARDIEALREAGCICPSPLEAAKPDRPIGAADESCPIKGHGIPF